MVDTTEVKSFLEEYEMHQELRMVSNAELTCLHKVVQVLKGVNHSLKRRKVRLKDAYYRDKKFSNKPEYLNKIESEFKEALRVIDETESQCKERMESVNAIKNRLLGEAANQTSEQANNEVT